MLYRLRALPLAVVVTIGVDPGWRAQHRAGDHEQAPMLLRGNCRDPARRASQRNRSTARMVARAIRGMLLLPMGVPAPKLSVSATARFRLGIAEGADAAVAIVTKRIGSTHTRR